MTTINGKAHVRSLDAFLKKYPNGKVPRSSPEFGKAFVCRRGCNTRTATYTEEFVWEELYHRDTHSLAEFVSKRTKATRRRRQVKEPSPEDDDYRAGVDAEDVDDPEATKRTPKKRRTQDDVATPRKQRSASKKPITPSHRKCDFP